MVIIPGAQTTQDTFTVATKSKGFVPNQTKIVALAQGSNHNTSEFSGAIIIPGPNATTIGAPDGDSTSAPKIEVEAPPKDEATNKGESSEGGSNGGEPNNAEGNKPAGADAATPANTNSNIVTPAIVTSPSAPQAKAPDKPSEPETTINLNGAGEPGHEPDSGSMSDKSAKISALGI